MHSAKKQIVEKENIEELNHLFSPLSYLERIEKLYDFYTEKEILFTSSFGIKSIFLIHAMQKIRPSQHIHFIDTTYHFDETIIYKEHLQKKYSLKIIDVLPDAIQNELTKTEAWWNDHPKMCCSINKVVPLQSYTAKHKIWISGLRKYQTKHRSSLSIFEKKGDIIKFYPLLDVSELEFQRIKSKNNLENHPLEEQGYGSVGCKHCTVKGKGRDGRWKDKNRTECGLHLNYFYNKK
jgi:phosphoadenosine phosphosulfate reductase